MIADSVVSANLKEIVAIWWLDHAIVEAAVATMEVVRPLGFKTINLKEIVDVVADHAGVEAAVATTMVKRQRQGDIRFHLFIDRDEDGDGV